MLWGTPFSVLSLAIAAIVSLTVACSSSTTGQWKSLSTTGQWKPDEARASRPVLPEAAETRIALVIGNSAYPSGPLASPKDDAKAIETKLKVLGFQVTTKIDLDRKEFVNAIRDFGDRLQQSGTVGLFYYSGHGMQVDNRNYMIPTDADIRSEVDVRRDAVQVEEILAYMKLGKGNPNILILDACRDNPFEKRFKSAQDGLAKMDAPAFSDSGGQGGRTLRGTLIAFAAEPGRVAEAGSGGKLSLYTEQLVQNIDQPYASFISMFLKAHDAVINLSRERQIPHLDWSSGQPDFSFKPIVDVDGKFASMLQEYDSEIERLQGSDDFSADDGDRLKQLRALRSSLAQIQTIAPLAEAGHSAARPFSADDGDRLKQLRALRSSEAQIQTIAPLAEADHSAARPLGSGFGYIPEPLPEAGRPAVALGAGAIRASVEDVEDMTGGLASSLQLMTTNIEQLLSKDDLSADETRSLQGLMLKRAELSMFISQIQTSAHETRKHLIQNTRN